MLGVLDGARYHTASVQTAGGDLLVLFSDGITEAIDDRAVPCDDRLIHAMQPSQDLRPARSATSSLLQSSLRRNGTAADANVHIVSLEAAQ